MEGKRDDAKEVKKGDEMIVTSLKRQRKKVWEDLEGLEREAERNRKDSREYSRLAKAASVRAEVNDRVS